MIPVSDSRISLPSEPDMRDLQNYVAAQIPHRWRSFGTQLGIPHNTLEAIALKNNQNHTYPFIEVLHEWKKAGKYPFTWDKVIDVLSSQALKETKLADEICKILLSRLP